VIHYSLPVRLSDPVVGHINHKEGRMPKLYEPGLRDAPISSLLEVGEYIAQVEGWDFFYGKENQNKTPENYDGIKLEMTVLQGPPQGEVGWDPVGKKLFPLLNRPRTNMKDGGMYCRAKIKKFCLAAGVEMDENDGWDPDEFIGRQMPVKVKVQPGKDGRDPQNDVDGIIPAASAAEA
jgi:hypothetical protein